MVKLTLFTLEGEGLEAGLLRGRLLFFFKDRFSAASGSKEFGPLVRSCAPQISPDRLLGLAWGENCMYENTEIIPSKNSFKLKSLLYKLNSALLIQKCI